MAQARIELQCAREDLLASETRVCDLECALNDARRRRSELDEADTMSEAKSFSEAKSSSAKTTSATKPEVEASGAPPPKSPTLSSLQAQLEQELNGLNSPLHTPELLPELTLNPSVVEMELAVAREKLDSSRKELDSSRVEMDGLREGLLIEKERGREVEALLQQAEARAIAGEEKARVGAEALIVIDLNPNLDP